MIGVNCSRSRPYQSGAKRTCPILGPSIIESATDRDAVSRSVADADGL